MPPEYCSFIKKDLTECKKWLSENHLVLYQKLYGSEQPAEEEKKEGAEGKKSKKPKKKVQFGQEGGAKKITFIKKKRGNKKTIS